MGWPYFPWSGGYDSDTRLKVMESLLTALDLPTTCKVLKKNKIDYVIINTQFQDIPTDTRFFEANFVKQWEGDGYRIYDVQSSCSG